MLTLIWHFSGGQRPAPLLLRPHLLILRSYCCWRLTLRPLFQNYLTRKTGDIITLKKSFYWIIIVLLCSLCSLINSLFIILSLIVNKEPAGPFAPTRTPLIFSNFLWLIPGVAVTVWLGDRPCRSHAQSVFAVSAYFSPLRWFNRENVAVPYQFCSLGLTCVLIKILLDNTPYKWEKYSSKTYQYNFWNV